MLSQCAYLTDRRLLASISINKGFGICWHILKRNFKTEYCVVGFLRFIYLFLYILPVCTSASKGVRRLCQIPWNPSYNSCESSGVGT